MWMWKLRRRDRAVMWLAWRLPRRLAYWATIRVAVHEYGGNPGERPVENALKGWEDRD